MGVPARGGHQLGAAAGRRKALLDQLRSFLHEIAIYFRVGRTSQDAGELVGVERAVVLD